MHVHPILHTIFTVLTICQGALDYDGNLRRIGEAIQQAKSRGATILNVPELAITGYGCLDHFLEGDLYVLAIPAACVGSTC